MRLFFVRDNVKNKVVVWGGGQEGLVAPGATTQVKRAPVQLPCLQALPVEAAHSGHTDPGVEQARVRVGLVIEASRLHEAILRRPPVPLSRRFLHHTALHTTPQLP
jgi:hypothetical protein